MTPKLVYDFMTGTVYIATKYTEDALGRIKVIEKVDVTQDFDDINLKRQLWEHNPVGIAAKERLREKFV